MMNVTNLKIEYIPRKNTKYQSGNNREPEQTNNTKEVKMGVSHSL